MSDRPRRASAGTPSPVRKKPKLANDPARVLAYRNEVKELQGHSELTREDRLAMLNVYFYFLEAGHDAQAKTGRKVPIRAHERTAKALQRSSTTVGAVVKAWTDASDDAEGRTDALALSSHRGNRKQKEARVDHTKQTYYRVRDFVRGKRMAHERVTATQVMEFMIEKGILETDMDHNGVLTAKGKVACERAVRRYLVRKGFRRGTKTGSVSINPKRLAERDAYLRAVLENRELPVGERLREVYLDESYVHQNYSRAENSVYDPNDEQCRPPKRKNKGRRYCILAAVQGDSPGQPMTAGLVPGSVWTFCPQAKKMSLGDYHKNFNGDNFALWWTEQLLPNLRQPSLIIMDNAAYHKCKPPGTPNPNKMKKAEVRAALEQFGVPFDVRMSAAEGKVLLRDWINANVKAHVVTLAEAAGHRVLFTPLHYSDLQPIELVWALVKGNIGRQYSHGTTLKDVKERLDKEFDKLGTPAGGDAVGRIIKSVDKVIAKFVKEMESEDAYDDLGSESEGEGSDEDISSGESDAE